MADMREVILERRRSSTTSETADLKSMQRTRVWRSKEQINVPEQVLKDYQARTELLSGAESTTESTKAIDHKIKAVAEVHASVGELAEKKRRATVQQKIKLGPAGPVRPQRQSLPAQFGAKSMTKAELDSMLNDDMVMRQELEELSLLESSQVAAGQDEDTLQGQPDAFNNIKEEAATTDSSDGSVEQLIDLATAAAETTGTHH